MKKALCILPVFLFAFVTVCLAAPPPGGTDKAPSSQSIKEKIEGGSHGSSVLTYEEPRERMDRETERPEIMAKPPGPLELATPPLPAWRHVAAGLQHTCAIAGNGTLWCWGDNTFGQLGVNKPYSELTTSISPRQVGRDRWRSVSSKSYHTCAIKADRTLWCWGVNDMGRLGTGDRINKISPTQVGTDADWAAVSVGVAHTCGLKEDGILMCWGDERHGELGGSGPDQEFLHFIISPRPVLSPEIGESRSMEALMVSAGSANTCAVQKSDGMAYCWGLNNAGQLGNDTIRIGDIARTPVPVTGYIRNFSLLSVGSGFICGIVDPEGDGKLYCWGSDRYGQLGNGDSSTHNMRFPYPVLPGGYKDWKKISAGILHACGVKTDGALYCWGDNYFGELGDGTSGTGNYSSSPKRIFEGVSKVSAGYYHTCAITVEGHLYCWGYNERGQIGNGSDINQLTPVRVIRIEAHEPPPMEPMP